MAAPTAEDQELSYGTILEYNSTGSTYVELTKVYDASGPGYERKEIMLGNLRQDVARKKLGRLNIGDVTLKCGYNKTGYDFFITEIKANNYKNYRFTMPETSTEIFPARVKSISKTYSDDERLVYDVVLSCDGDTTWTKAV